MFVLCVFLQRFFTWLWERDLLSERCWTPSVHLCCLFEVLQHASLREKGLQKPLGLTRGMVDRGSSKGGISRLTSISQNKVSEATKRGRSKRGRTQKHATDRKWAQMSANTRERKRAQTSLKERKRPGSKQPVWEVPKVGWTQKRQGWAHLSQDLMGNLCEKWALTKKKEIALGNPKRQLLNGNRRMVRKSATMDDQKVRSHRPLNGPF